jgi:hypothetical protein
VILVIMDFLLDVCARPVARDEQPQQCASGRSALDRAAAGAQLLSMWENCRKGIVRLIPLKMDDPSAVG